MLHNGWHVLKIISTAKRGAKGQGYQPLFRPPFRVSALKTCVRRAAESALALGNKVALHVYSSTVTSSIVEHISSTAIKPAVEDEFLF